VHVPLQLSRGRVAARGDRLGRALAAAAGLALCAPGCGGSATAPPPDGGLVLPSSATLDLGPAAAALGVGSDAYSPLAAGASVQVIHGPQGGYHIVVAIRATGIWPGTPSLPGAPDLPTTTLHAAREDGSMLGLDAFNVFRQPYAPGPDGDDYLVGKLLRLDPSAIPGIAGAHLVLGVDLVDRDGRAVSDEKHVIALAPVN
jgi:hypothetical protein